MATRTGKKNLPHKPKLGQNFLADPGAAQRIVNALGELSTATVIEIGPGGGILTDLLARQTQRLIAIEIDRVLAAQLRMKYARHSNVEIIEADVLSLDFANVIRRKPEPLLAGPPQHSGNPQKAQVVGNLPYYITSDILLRLLHYHALLETIVLMVQREVADRIVAQPGSREYGLLSATVQLYTQTERLFTLPPNAFSPAPRVHSSVVRLTIAPQAKSLGINTEAFIEFLKKCFAQKRKTLFNNLKSHYEEAAIHAALKSAAVRPDARAEAVSLKKTAKIFHVLKDG